MIAPYVLFYVASRLARRPPLPPPPPPRTLIDPTDLPSARRLVERFAPLGADRMMDHLYKIYVAFEPRETTMQFLSMVLDAERGKGGETEYVCATLLMAQMSAIQDTTERPSRVKRTRSSSCLRFLT